MQARLFEATGNGENARQRIWGGNPIERDMPSKS